MAVGGLALRVARLDHGVLPNEYAMLAPEGLGWHLASHENGINPPLLRLLMALGGASHDAVGVGRALALVAGIVLVLATFDAVRRLPGAGPGRGLAAALLVAVHPMLVTYGAVARSYAPATATLAVHLAALARVGNGGPGQAPGAFRAWLTAGLLLPWWHYTLLPGVVAEAALLAWQAPAWRRPLTRALPLVVLAWAPLAYWVVAQGEARAPTTSLAQTARYLLDLGLPRTGDVDAARRTLLPLMVVGGLAAWPRLDLARRSTLVVLVTTAAFLLVTSLAHITRPPLVLFVLVPAVVFGASLPGRWAAAALVAGGALLAPGVVAGLTGEPPGLHEGAAPAEAAAAWGAWDDVRAGRPVWVPDANVAILLHFALTGHHHRQVAPTAGCPSVGVCFVHEGVLVRSLGEGAPDGLLLVPHQVPETPVPAGCARVAGRETFDVFTCGPATGSGAAPPRLPRR